ncbi:MAG: hypothetical protein V1650_00170 [Candidatus Omnitrophota bacterium]
MYRKSILVVFIVCLFFYFTLPTFASQAPPAPVCEVEAEILNLKEVEFCDNVTVYMTLLTDMKIISTGKMLKEGYPLSYKDFKCSSYQDQVIKGIRIAPDKELKVGQKVSGALSYFANENWQGDVLTSVKILEQPTNSPGGKDAK